MNNNQFKFTLKQSDLLLYEKIFDADVFNPFTRYSIDIREVLPQSITKLQKILSKKRYDVTLNEYDLFHFYKNQLAMYPKDVRNDLEYKPKVSKHQIDDKVIKGVECKIGLYINDNPIVERIFFVDGYNPVARFSSDLLNVFQEISNDIFKSIKKADKRNMWDDYDLINYKGLSINQIRDLPLNKRKGMLRSIRR